MRGEGDITPLVVNLGTVWCELPATRHDQFTCPEGGPLDKSHVGQIMFMQSNYA